MTEGDGPSVTNLAVDEARVGVQAGFVHQVNNYMTAAEDPPAERFETAIACLDGGMRERARKLIKELVAENWVNDRVCFYWLVALTSGRTRQELHPDEAEALRDPPPAIRVDDDGEWAAAFRVGRHFTDESADSVDPKVLVKELDELHKVQRSLLLRHLAMFLDGAIEKHLWSRILDQAKEFQFAKERGSRVWKFFEPTPVGPRAWRPRPVDVRARHWLQLTGSSALLLATVGNISFILTQGDQPAALTAYLLGTVGGCVGAYARVDWYVRTHLADGDTAHLSSSDSEHNLRADTERHTGKIRNRFDYYFYKYRPREEDGHQSDWIDQTLWVRQRLSELVAQRYPWVAVEQIAYLIRHLTVEAKRRWLAGTLRRPVEDFSTSLFTKAATLLGIAAFGFGGSWGFVYAATTDPAATVVTLFFAAVIGHWAVRTWTRISAEKLRYAVDRRECEHLNKGCEAAYHRWLDVLADRPEDTEMAGWLDCDRMLLLGEALHHYQLPMNKVVAYGFIETPVASAKRARVRSGPWRYSGYRMLLFLLTHNGVRQVTTRLAFEKGTFHDRRRTNFRFDAVAHVGVVQDDGGERDFELSLVNGQSIKLQLTGHRIEDSLIIPRQASERSEDPRNADRVAAVTLEASGIDHTMHILEGVAAEGTEWVRQWSRRTMTHTENLK